MQQRHWPSAQPNIFFYKLLVQASVPGRHTHSAHYICAAQSYMHIHHACQWHSLCSASWTRKLMRGMCILSRGSRMPTRSRKALKSASKGRGQQHCLLAHPRMPMRSRRHLQAPERGGDLLRQHSLLVGARMPMRSRKALTGMRACQCAAQ